MFAINNIQNLRTKNTFKGTNKVSRPVLRCEQNDTFELTGNGKNAPQNGGLKVDSAGVLPGIKKKVYSIRQKSDFIRECIDKRVFDYIDREWFYKLSDKKTEKTIEAISNKDIQELLKHEKMYVFNFSDADERFGDEEYAKFCELIQTPAMIRLAQSEKMKPCDIVYFLKNADKKYNLKFLDLLFDEKITGLIESGGLDKFDFCKFSRFSEAKQEVCLKLLQLEAFADRYKKKDAIFYDLEQILNNMSDEFAEEILSDEEVEEKFLEIFGIVFHSDEIICKGLQIADINELDEGNRKLLFALLQSDYIMESIGNIPSNIAYVIQSVKRVNSDEAFELLADENKFDMFITLIERTNKIVPDLYTRNRFTDEQKDEIKALDKAGYRIDFYTKQKGRGNMFICSKTGSGSSDNTTIRYVFNDDGTKLSDKTSLDDDAFAVQSRSVEGRIKGSGLEIEQQYGFLNLTDGIFSSDGSKILREIELVLDKNGEPDEVIVTKYSKKLKGAYEVIAYKFAEYPEEYDVLGAIKAGTITGGKKLAEVSKSLDGNTSLNETFEYNSSLTKRKYAEKRRIFGIKSNKYSYQITDNNDKKLLDIERSFETISSNTTKTIVNGREYIAHFDEDNMKIIVEGDFEGGKVEINVLSKLNVEGVSNSDKMKKQFWKTLKEVPADILLLFEEKITSVSVNNPKERGDSIYKGELTSSCSVSALYHELGHAIGADEILPNEEIFETYKKEFDEFSQKYPEIKQREIEYFSDKSDAKGFDEFVAETLVVLTTYGHKDELSYRSYNLVRYFPKTVAMIAEHLNLNNSR